MLGTQDGYKPLLITDLDHKPKSSVREKRSTDEPCNPVTSCCKRSWNVSIATLGLHSGFRPHSLRIGYCFGTCQGMTEFGSNHTALKNWMINNGNNDEIQLCCVPSRLTSVNILRYVNGNEHLSIIPSIKVVSCGCR
ncbi:growth/differentiation factor 8 [Elysia marginata]|uniref:Growth/differentiation factor 8 n=1 Tax=Elysia marginata TaxID=1093978 RepID=A0AAV4J720_9GAST|nr:growth/differentiation factor 8 [Elysia marginata]